MRSWVLPLLLLLGAASLQAGDIRDLVNSDTKAKTARFTMGDKINFFFTGGARDTEVLLRAFPGTREEVVARAKAYAPSCAQLDHLVFGGWWTTTRRLTFNYRFTEWALSNPNADGDGTWLFIFEAQPASGRTMPAGLIGMQSVEIKQPDIEAYFNTGLEVTVFNNAPVSVSRANSVPAPILKRLQCNIANHVLPGTMQVASANETKIAAILLARRRAAEAAQAAR